MYKLLAIAESHLSQMLKCYELEQQSPKPGARDQGRNVVSASGKIAVLPIRGVMRAQTESAWFGEILGSDHYMREIEQLGQDGSISTIILDINSPGGEVAGTMELANCIAEVGQTKPIVASVGPLAASAAYWIASQCQSISCQPSGEVGSIGVILAHLSYAKYLEQEGLKVTLITSGKYKGEGNPYQDLNDETLSHYQDQCDDIYERFVDAVATGRKVSSESVKAYFGEGRTMMAHQAKAVGMVDDIETLPQLLTRLGAKTGMQKSSKSLLRARHELLTLMEGK